MTCVEFAFPSRKYLDIGLTNPDVAPILDSLDMSWTVGIEPLRQQVRSEDSAGRLHRPGILPGAASRGAK